MVGGVAQCELHIVQQISAVWCGCKYSMCIRRRLGALIEVSLIYPHLRNS